MRQTQSTRCMLLYSECDCMHAFISSYFMIICSNIYSADLVMHACVEAKSNDIIRKSFWIFVSTNRERVTHIHRQTTCLIGWMPVFSRRVSNYMSEMKNWIKTREILVISFSLAKRSQKDDIINVQAGPLTCASPLEICIHRTAIVFVLVDFWFFLHLSFYVFVLRIDFFLYLITKYVHKIYLFNAENLRNFYRAKKSFLIKSLQCFPMKSTRQQMTFNSKHK